MAEDFTASGFFAAYAPRLRAFLRPRISPRLRQRFDESDILSSAFRSYFLRLSSVDLDDEEFDPWPLLVEIAVHKLARQVRRHTADRRSVQRELANAESEAGKQSGPDHQAELHELLESVSRSLPSDVAEVWKLRLEGWEQADIAKRLGISERTVRRHLVQAKERLHELLREEQCLKADGHTVTSSLSLDLRDYVLQQ